MPEDSPDALVCARHFIRMRIFAVSPLRMPMCIRQPNCERKCMKPTLLLSLTLLLAITCARTAHAACPDASRASTPQTSFGPEQQPEALIVETVQSARDTLHLAAFAFSSPRVVEALVAAAKRGVQVKVVVDHKHNVAEDPKQIGRKALAALVAAGVAVHTNDRYRIHHDKFIIIDACHVQTGSWNYADSARQNSENVVVLWNSPDVARDYLAHWKARFEEGRAFRAEVR